MRVKFINVEVPVKESVANTNIEMLELSERSKNVCRRCGYNTIGNVLDAGYDGINRHKGAGDTVIREIMSKSFNYIINSFDEERQLSIWSNIRKQIKVNGGI